MSKKISKFEFRACANRIRIFSHVISMGDILDVFSALWLARDKRISASGRVLAEDGLVWEIFSKFEFRACANRRSHIIEFFTCWYYISIYFNQICYIESWCNVNTYFFHQDDFFFEMFAATDRRKSHEKLAFLIFSRFEKFQKSYWSTCRVDY